jgi:hypothetical protein
MNTTWQENWQKIRPIDFRMLSGNIPEIDRKMTEKIRPVLAWKKVEGEAFAMVSRLSLTSATHYGSVVISRPVAKCCHFRGFAR